MNPSLCQTFRSIAFRTFDHLGTARVVKHQPLEETFTDLNILDLKVRHGSEIYSKTFSKKVEGRNGADWEWWLTNGAMNNWLGLRVQAKVLHLGSDCFEHLHYKSGDPKEYQRVKLKLASERDGLVPLYCYYLHSPNLTKSVSAICGTFPYAMEAYGCSLSSLAHVERLFNAGEKNDLASVLRRSYPWHCLVCCSGYGGGDLPTQAWEFLKGAFDIRESDQEADGGRVPRISIGPRRDAPRHVLEAIEGVESESAPVDIGGVLIIQSSVSGGG